MLHIVIFLCNFIYVIEKKNCKLLLWKKYLICLLLLRNHNLKLKNMASELNFLADISTRDVT